MTLRPTALVALLACALAAASGCSSPANPAPAKPSSTHTRHYLHPTRDLSKLIVDCDSDQEPYVTLWVTNHSNHSMAYDIKYDLVSKDGKVVGSAGGVFETAAHQILGDERLFDTLGRCGTTARLAYVNAYDNSGEDAQPAF
ncbi:hypothetical protein ACFZC3_15635 [Streptomyces sp. NPDC007903]|uniref:hypothetical protein n=1 Tax=Streptomyces sp. NPDC007903 TaxID=3364786 RepID=UPI0036EC5FF2